MTDAGVSGAGHTADTDELVEALRGVGYQSIGVHNTMRWAAAEIAALREQVVQAETDRDAARDDATHNANACDHQARRAVSAERRLAALEDALREIVSDELAAFANGEGYMHRLARCGYVARSALDAGVDSLAVGPPERTTE